MKIRPLPFHVFDELHNLRARTGSLEDALNFVATLRDGASVRVYRPNAVLWTKGGEAWPMSLEQALATMRSRLKARHP